MENNIPKVIHYCWFGGNPLPELAKKCIESWRKFCPDYEIVEWNENNYDVNVCDYTREAYKEKKWAFVSDYARFDVLNKYGGVYFDTDVELIKPIEDIVDRGPFTGKEDEAGTRVAPGLALGSYAGFPLFEEIIDYYKCQHFITDNGYNQKTIVMYMTEILKKYNYKPSNECDKINELIIYPKRYFCPMDYYTGELSITEETRSIHHYTESWKSSKQKKWHRLEGVVCRMFNEKNAVLVLNSKFVRLVYHIYIDGIGMTIKKVHKKMKRK